MIRPKGQEGAVEPISPRLRDRLRGLVGATVLSVLVGVALALTVAVALVVLVLVVLTVLA